MIRISQLKIKTGHSREELFQRLLRVLLTPADQVVSWQIHRQSLDARKKPELYYVYTIDVQVRQEGAVLKKLRRRRTGCQIELCREEPYRFPEAGAQRLCHRPVIVGCGPAGLFCAYFLARHGYAPLLIERGAAVEERQKDVEEFWKTGLLKPDSNVQFGEGGAGAFSDGKLNTLVKDVRGLSREVLRIFVSCGAPEDILYQSKPHIGTDVLVSVIRSMRGQICGWGGEFWFHTRMDEIALDPDRRLCGLWLCEERWDADCGERRFLPAETVILAPGHSARDTFAMLYEKGVPLEAKPFAVGVRAEHPQELINLSQYGAGYDPSLPAAAYKLTAKTSGGRGVYSFCMCPGGYVVDASSEEGYLAVNGMSYSRRDGKNANSAIVVTVTPEDYGEEHPLAGVAFQRRLERASYLAGAGRIPVQRLGDFRRPEGAALESAEDYVSRERSKPPRETAKDTVDPEFEPAIKGRYRMADLRPIFPAPIRESLLEGMEQFDKKIPGFASPRVLLSAVESRTSSPVRILRGEEMESEISGLYPCGEGAGYAGGITSAAMDGIRAAEAIRRRFAPADKGESPAPSAVKI